MSIPLAYLLGRASVRKSAAGGPFGGLQEGLGTLRNTAAGMFPWQGQRMGGPVTPQEVAINRGRMARPTPPASPAMTLGNLRSFGAAMQPWQGQVMHGPITGQEVSQARGMPPAPAPHEMGMRDFFPYSGQQVIGPGR